MRGKRKKSVGKKGTSNASKVDKRVTRSLSSGGNSFSSAIVIDDGPSDTSNAIVIVDGSSDSSNSIAIVANDESLTNLRESKSSNASKVDTRNVSSVYNNFSVIDDGSSDSSNGIGIILDDESLTYIRESKSSSSTTSALAEIVDLCATPSSADIKECESSNIASSVLSENMSDTIFNSVSNQKLSENVEDSEIGVSKVKRVRRSFPTLNDETKQSTSSDISCRIYTSQLQKLKEKKEKFENGLKDLITSLADEDSSNDEPAVSQRKETSTETGDKISTTTVQPTKPISSVSNTQGQGKKKKKIPKHTKALYRNLDKLISDYEQNRNVLDTSLVDADPSPTTTPLNTKLYISIRWKTKILSFRLESNETFSKLLPELSSKLEAPPSKICLILNGKLINYSQTPSEVNIKLGSVIECVVSADDNNNSDPASNVASGDMIEVKIQSNVARQKVTLKCSKVEPLQKVLEEFARLKNLNPEQLSMKFDGEKVDTSETPSDLDLEDGDCLDVIVHS